MSDFNEQELTCLPIEFFQKYVDSFDFIKFMDKTSKWWL